MTDKDYEKFLARLGKEYGPESGKAALVSALEDEALTVEAISTGSLQIDRLTGVGGIPRGRITELFGKPGGGKSTLAWGAIREAQRAGERCAIVDTEYAVYPAWARSQGVDTDRDRLIVARAEAGEDALDLMDEFCRSGLFALVVLDSVAGVISRKELAADSVEQQFMGTRAKLMSQALNRVKGALDTSNCALLLLNQVREQVGVTYGDPRYRPGGKAQDFYSSLMLEVRKGQPIEQGKEVVGMTVKVAGYKSRFGAFAKAYVPEVRVLREGGIDRAWDLLQVAIEDGVVTKRGAFCYLGEERLGQGEENAAATLRERPELFAALDARLRGAA